MTFSFNLEWDELPEELREQKIDEYMTDKFETYNPYDEAEANAKADTTLAEYLENQDERADAERCISAHFPIYF